MVKPSALAALPASKSTYHLIFGSKQSVDSKRIAHTQSVAWRIVVQPKGEVEIHLLGGGQAVQASRVQQDDGTSSLWIIANIFREQTKLLRQFLLDDKGGLRHTLRSQFSGPEELGEHATQTPAVMQLP